MTPELSHIKQISEENEIQTQKLNQIQQQASTINKFKGNVWGSWGIKGA